MPANAISDPDMWAQAEAERKNFDFTTRTLGTTVELVQDLQDLYKSLAGFVIIPGGGMATQEANVTMLALHLLMKSRGSLLLGAMTLLRGYRSHSMIFLRSAIEACAFSALVRRKPTLADVWLNAGENREAYRRYANAFKGRELFPANDAQLQELYERYDWSSKMIHSSLYSMAGHTEYPGDPAEMSMNFKLFDLPSGTHEISSGFYLIVDSHQRIIQKYAEVLKEEIKGNVTAWDAHSSRVDAKMDLHREKWKAVAIAPRKARRS